MKKQMPPLPNVEFMGFTSPESLDLFLTRQEWVYRIFGGGSVEFHEEIHRSYEGTFETAPIGASGDPAPLPAEPADHSALIHIEGHPEHGIPTEDFELEEFFERVNVVGFAVVHEGKLVRESYYRDHDETVRWMTNSASKLITATLVEIALEAGDIGSLDDQINNYWPELAETAWNGTTVKDLVDMKSGMDWDEEDLDLFRDCPWSRLLHAWAFGSVEDFMVGMDRLNPPGEYLLYSSVDTEMLASILTRATGRSLAEYCEEKIWRPGGLEFPAYWVADGSGREMGLSGLCATLRDYARLAWMFADEGRSTNGNEVIPKAMIDRLTSPGPELFDSPGVDAYPLVPWNQSFVSSKREDSEGDFMACGSYGQILYANPEKRTAIAVQSVYPDIVNEYPEMYRQFMACRQIADELAG